jgi:hypothetical protein
MDVFNPKTRVQFIGCRAREREEEEHAMTETAKRRGGRPPFVPTDEQRKNVKIPVGRGIPEEHICALVRDYRDRPIGPDPLRKYFRKEIEIGAGSTLRSAIS